MSTQIWQWDGGAIDQSAPDWLSKRVQPGWSPLVGNGDLIVLTTMGAVRLKKEDWLFFVDDELHAMKNSLYQAISGITLMRGF